jgi:hypothetical protein
MDQFDVDRDPHELSIAVAEEYRAIAADLSMREGCKPFHTLRQLQSLWELSNWASFYTGEALYLSRLSTCFKELEQRGALTTAIGFRTFQAYVRHREFDSAREMPKTHPNMNFPELPLMTEANAADPSVISIATRSPVTFVRKSIDLNKQRTVVVVASADCHFAQSAAAAIQSDPELLSQLKGALWVSPQNDLLRFDSIQRWNDRHPFALLSVAYSQSGFNGLDLSHSPTFYVLIGGRVADKLVGWDESANPALALKRMLSGKQSNQLQ